MTTSSTPSTSSSSFSSSFSSSNLSFSSSNSSSSSSSSTPPSESFKITTAGLKKIESAVKEYNIKATEEYALLPTSTKVTIAALDIIKTIGAIVTAGGLVFAIITFSMVALSISALSFAVALLCDKLNPGIPLTELTACWQKVHRAILDKGNGESIIEALKQFQAQKEQKNSRYDKIVEHVDGNSERMLNSMWVMGYLLLAINKAYDGDEDAAKSNAILALNKYFVSELFDKNGIDVANLARLIMDNAKMLGCSELFRGSLQNFHTHDKIAHIDSLINACRKSSDVRITSFFRAES